MHARCVFVAGIHPSRIRMSGSFESVWWHACVHKLDLGLYSRPEMFLRNGVRTHVNSKGKIPFSGSSEEDRTRDTASGWTASPTHYQLSYSGPQIFKFSPLTTAVHNMTSSVFQKHYTYCLNIELHSTVSKAEWTVQHKFTMAGSNG